MQFVILPAGSGSLGLSGIIRPLLPAGSNSNSVDLLDEKYRQEYSHFKIGGLDAVALNIVEKTPELASSGEELVIVSSCQGAILALEIAKQMPRPPKHMILLDPEPMPFTTSRNSLKFYCQNIVDVLWVYFKYHKKMISKNFWKAPRFVKFSMYMKARYLWFYHDRSLCKLTVLVCRDRNLIKNSFFSRNLSPDFIFTRLSHRELFHSAEGREEIIATVRKALQLY